MNKYNSKYFVGRLNKIMHLIVFSYVHFLYIIKKFNVINRVLFLKIVIIL